MTGYLLDTNVAVIALTEPDLLSPEVRGAIGTGPNWLSVLTYWEVMLKSMKGKLEVGIPRIWWADALQQLAATALLLRSEHIAEVQHLPMIHQDPFDRALMAQAMFENLTILTTDDTIGLYAPDRFLVIQ